ncbi:MAG TPA: long-chain fatty acid--CoA ligase [Planctomycetes bacterium]|nr:long-chain fatty acid--CoA ligase [Planctomycetota bacterium]
MNVSSPQWQRAPQVELVEVGGLWIHRSVPALFQRRVKEFPHEVFAYVRDAAGEWQPTSWAAADQVVERMARGLIALGIEHGDRVAIVSGTRPEWVLCDQAILHVGGVVVGVYPTLPAAEVAYQLEHSGARLVFFEDAEQRDKLAEIRERLPQLEHLVAIDPAAKREGDLDLASLAQLGAELSAGEERFAERWSAVGPEDLATIVYTSGTTGRPKGAELLHQNICYTVQTVAASLPHGDESSVIFLPMAHVLQRVASYGGLVAHAEGYYTASYQTLMDDIREVEPTVQVSVPRIWEKLHARLHEHLAQASERRQRIFHWGLEVGREASPLLKAGQALPLGLRLKLAVARRLVHEPLRARVFGRNIRYLTSGGAPIDTEILEFFHALGILILEGWGLTETAAPATVNYPDAFRFGTVGRPIEGTEVERAEDGELLVRGPGVFRGYFRDEEATRAAFDERGFFRTGDIGEIDAEGFVRITDRKKNLIVLSNGKNVAPQKIENLLQTIPVVGNAMVHGDRRSYLVALICLDPEEALPWAIRRGILPEGAQAEAMAELVDDPRLLEYVDEQVRERNAALPRHEQLKRWHVVAETWSPEDGTLTPTLKLKRREIAARHAELLESLYS